MSDVQKYTADVEVQEDETANTTDELTNEELDQVAVGSESHSARHQAHRTWTPIAIITRIDRTSP